MKQAINCIVFVLFSLVMQAQHRLYAPDKSIEVIVQMGTQVTYAVNYKGQQVVAPSPLNLIINDNDSLLSHAVVKKAKRRSVTSTIIPPVPEKRKTIADMYNELQLQFNRPVTLTIRAYNDGVAYRFETRIRDSVIVQNEVANFRFTPTTMVYYPEVQKRQDADLFHTSFEENYSIKPLDSMAQDSIAFTPVLIAQPAAKIVITESDLE